MDREDRWNLYINEYFQQEVSNLQSVDSFVEEFAFLSKNEGLERILDVGCGLGRHTHYLMNKGFDVVGLDISPQTLKLAERAGRSIGIQPELVQGDYYDMPFHSDAFDAVVAVNTLHHDFPENIIQAFNEIHRVLRTGGLFCFNPLTTGDGYFNKGRKLGERLFLIHRIPHYFFETTELDLILKKTFFDVIDVKLESFVSEFEGEPVQRERLRVVARSVSKGRSHLNHLHRPLY